VLVQQNILGAPGEKETVTTSSRALVVEAAPEDFMVTVSLVRTARWTTALVALVVPEIVQAAVAVVLAGAPAATVALGVRGPSMTPHTAPVVVVAAEMLTAQAQPTAARAARTALGVVVAQLMVILLLSAMAATVHKASSSSRTMRIRPSRHTCRPLSSTSNSMRRLNPKRKKQVVAAAVLAVAVVGVAGYFLFARGGAPTPQASAPIFDLPTVSGATAPIPSTTAAPRAAPAGYVEYRDAQYGFSLFYPQELTVKKYDEGGGASTFVFQSIKPVEGFQMFIVPYSGTQVSAQRFQEDEPSGVREDPTYGLIDGASAASFYSSDATLGDTYEVWFIHNGYLYEVTTLKPLDTWLQGIMQTWEFLGTA
jgi:hypothetical protein